MLLAGEQQLGGLQLTEAKDDEALGGGGIGFASGLGPAKAASMNAPCLSVPCYSHRGAKSSFYNGQGNVKIINSNLRAVKRLRFAGKVLCLKDTPWLLSAICKREMRKASKLLMQNKFSPSDRLITTAIKIIPPGPTGTMRFNASLFTWGSSSLPSSPTSSHLITFACQQ